MTQPDPLAPGDHTVVIDGVRQSYHVAGSGPVCVVHPGGPGFSWDYLRIPAAEGQLTMVYVRPIGTAGSGRLPSHPHGYTRDRYSQFLDGLLDHLDLPRVHLLGHSHGGFVTQHYALHHPQRLAGIILYESAPAVGEEHFAEAMRNFDEFARRNADNPQLADVLAAWQSVPGITDDEAFTSVARRLFPAYFADYWARQAEFAPALASVGGAYISGLDADAAPVAIDDRSALGSLRVPTLVVVGQQDFICGPRWGQELHDLIPGSKLVVLPESGHFGHLEESETFTRVVVDFVTSRPA
ncbi:alpha/beta fold hydrolase [Micromonospora sp. GCM10011542]|uniref:alpha/beta fold hydrolase n=1 Tax=Micromonospora sp. GCM10011542 TaxID=3317337 RepID=UPI003610FFB9